jgi:hypothetical protein
VLQARGELDFPLEPLGVDRGAHFGRQYLDDHLPPQPGFLGQEDTAHPTATQLLLNAIGVSKGGLEARFEIFDRGFRVVGAL